MIFVADERPLNAAVNKMSSPPPSGAKPKFFESETSVASTSSPTENKLRVVLAIKVKSCGGLLKNAVHRKKQACRAHLSFSKLACAPVVNFLAAHGRQNRLFHAVQGRIANVAAAVGTTVSALKALVSVISLVILFHYTYQSSTITPRPVKAKRRRVRKFLVLLIFLAELLLCTVPRQINFPSSAELDQKFHLWNLINFLKKV